MMNTASQYHPIVLTVDDDHYTRHLLRRALELEGYAVIEAESGEQALEASTRLNPVIVLLDAMMPGMDGFEVSAKLQAQADSVRPQILMITSLNDQESIDRAFEVGATDYITKPIDMRVLRHRIRQILTTQQAETMMRSSNSDLEQRVAERTSELLEANRALKEEITARNFAEQQQRELVVRLRDVLASADDLMISQDVDTLFYRAVEIARQRLGLERCAIFLHEDDWLFGTYGTNYSGDTVDEHSLHLPMGEKWLEHFRKLHPRDEHWIVVEEALREWDGKQSVEIGMGWIAITPIWSAQRLLGVLLNDTAISGAALDPAKQELATVFCSLLANIVEQKRIQAALSTAQTQLEQRVEERTAALEQANEALNAEIVEHKRMEKALEESESRFRVLFESSPDAILLIDPDDPDVVWPIVACNEACCQMNGYAHHELIGKSIDLLNLNPDPDPVGRRAYLERVRREGRFSVEAVHRRKDGKRISIQSSTSLITLGGKELILGIDRDVTERNRMELAMIDYQEHLEKQVDHRTNALTLANQKLQQEIMERKQVEHELRYRGQFEKLITGISLRFINLPAEDIDAAITDALRTIGEFVGVDYIYLIEFSTDRSVKIANQWYAKAIDQRWALAEIVSTDPTSWYMDKMAQFESVYVPRVADLPTGDKVRRLFDSWGVKAHVGVPMSYAGKLVGVMGLDSIKTEKIWSRELVALLKTVGEICVSALERKQP
jgi:PAS domain S-box-containing protein